MTTNYEYEGEIPGVFGLKKGMTVVHIYAWGLGRATEIKKERVGTLYDIEGNPEIPEDAIARILIVPDKGLMKVTLLWMIMTNASGDEIKKKFEELRKIVSDKYGEGETTDRGGRFWKNWMQSLEDGEQVLHWYLGNVDKNEIEAIAIETLASGSTKVRAGYPDLRISGMQRTL